ncbi:MAG: nucleotidyltransferase domain-containing protein [Oscillatoriaceae cyanobacterium]
MNQPRLENFIYERRDQILAIAAKHGAYNVRIFGSFARNQAQETSDIDFLVDYDPTQRSPWFPMGLIQDLETLLERKVDVATPTMLKERMRERVMAEAVSL